MIQKFSFAGLLATMLVGVACTAQAQSLGNAGTIQGTVTDPTGAVLQGATVTAENPVTGYKQQATTAQNGWFRLVNLPRNSYHVRGSVSGTKRWATSCH